MREGVLEGGLLRALEMSQYDSSMLFLLKFETCLIGHDYIEVPTRHHCIPDGDVISPSSEEVSTTTSDSPPIVQSTPRMWIT